MRSASSPRGQHQARDTAGGADLAQGLDPAQAGHHDVEDDDGVLAGQRRAHAVLAVVDAGRLEALLSEVFREHADQFDVVVDEEYVIHGARIAKSGPRLLVGPGRFTSFYAACRRFTWGRNRMAAPNRLRKPR